MERTAKTINPAGQQGPGGNTRRSFALLSPCGWGNLGDAAIQDAVIAGIRRRVPNARILGITLNPADTSLRHGIPAFTLRGFSSTGYGINEEQSAPISASVAGEALGDPIPTQVVGANPTGRRTGLVGIIDRLTRPLRRPFYPVKQEILHIRTSLKLLRDVDILIASGGGQLDDYWGGAWGHPYVLFKWGMLAKWAHTRFVIFGVGTGTLQNPLSRFFVRRALALAEYRSFRDAGSRDLARRGKHTSDDTVHPDLAFMLDVSSYGSAPSSELKRDHVAISPMSYLDPRIWPEKSATAYNRYVETLAQLVADIMGQNYRVSLFATDEADERTIADLVAAVRRLPEGECASRIGLPQISSVSDVLTLLSSSHIVVASRLHGAILSCLMEKPTLALSYDRKVTVLMREMGLDEYCYEIATIDRQGLLQRIRRLADNEEKVVQALKMHNAQAREQLELILDSLIGNRIS